MISKFAKVSSPTSIDSYHFSERQKRIYNFLSHNPVGVLSSITLGGSPHGVIIYYAVKNDFSLTFLTRVGTRKYDNLSRDNRIALTVYDPKAQTTAQITGTATKTENSYEINSAAGAILDSTLRTGQPGLPPSSRRDTGKYVAFTIRPSQIRMAFFAKSDTDEYDQIFESVESFDLHEDGPDLPT